MCFKAKDNYNLKIYKFYLLGYRFIKKVYDMNYYVLKQKRFINIYKVKNLSFSW